MTVPVGLTYFLQRYRIGWVPSFAATMVTAIPFIIATMYLQKHIVRGLTLGAVTRYWSASRLKIWQNLSDTTDKEAKIN